MVATFRCRQCNALLPERRARCEICGYALDYNPAITRRERVMGFSMLGIAIAIAIAFSYAAAFILLD